MFPPTSFLPTPLPRSPSSLLHLHSHLALFIFHTGAGVTFGVSHFNHSLLLSSLSSHLSKLIDPENTFCKEVLQGLTELYIHFPAFQILPLPFSLCPASYSHSYSHWNPSSSLFPLQEIIYCRRPNAFPALPKTSHPSVAVLQSKNLVNWTSYFSVHFDFLSLCYFRPHFLAPDGSNSLLSYQVWWPSLQNMILGKGRHR